MADHARKQIRDTIQTGLAAAMTTVLAVHVAPVHPLDAELLPALLIFTPDETAEDINKAGHQARNLTVAFEIHAAGAAVVDALDAVALELEPLVFSAAPAFVKEIELTGTTTELTGDPVQTAGFCRLEYNFLYHVNPAAPDIPL